MDKGFATYQKTEGVCQKTDAVWIKGLRHEPRSECSCGSTPRMTSQDVGTILASSLGMERSYTMVVQQGREVNR